MAGESSSTPDRGGVVLDHGPGPIRGRPRPMPPRPVRRGPPRSGPRTTRSACPRPRTRPCADPASPGARRAAARTRAVELTRPAYSAAGSPPVDGGRRPADLRDRRAPAHPSIRRWNSSSCHAGGLLVGERTRATARAGSLSHGLDHLLGDGPHHVVRVGITGSSRSRRARAALDDGSHLAALARLGRPRPARRTRGGPRSRRARSTP